MGELKYQCPRWSRTLTAPCSLRPTAWLLQVAPGSEEAPDASVADAAEAARMHMAAHNQSEFVAQWVRTLTRQGTTTADAAGERDHIPASRAGTKDLMPVPPPHEHGSAGLRAALGGNSKCVRAGGVQAPGGLRCCNLVAVATLRSALIRSALSSNSELVAACRYHRRKKVSIKKMLELQPVAEEAAGGEGSGSDGGSDKGLSHAERSNISAQGGKPPSSGGDDASSVNDDVSMLVETRWRQAGLFP